MGTMSTAARKPESTESPRATYQAVLDAPAHRCAETGEAPLRIRDLGSPVSPAASARTPPGAGRGPAPRGPVLQARARGALVLLG